jgi:hypothetical protein
MKSAIVSTVKYPHNFKTWLDYYFKIGIERIYIFIDDENDLETIKICKSYSNVTYFINNFKLLDYQKKLFSSTHFSTLDEVMSRQIIACQTAIILARKESIEWLIHVDADELILIKNNLDLKDILNSYYKKGEKYIKMVNYEIAPEHSNYGNCFLEGTKFKTKSGFVGYANGKSMVYIGDNSIIKVDGVHTFITPWKHITSKDFIVLHYISCNFEEFIKKYRILGSFGDSWWNNVPISITFHKNSRDVVSGCKKSKEECENEALKFYEKNHVYGSQNSGDVIFINDVKNTLLS